MLNTSLNFVTPVKFITKIIMSSREMWRHTLVILSNVECARIGWSDVQTPHPHTTPKLQLDFLDLEIFLVKVWGGGGGGGSGARPPHHYT